LITELLIIEGEEFLVTVKAEKGTLT